MSSRRKLLIGSLLVGVLLIAFAILIPSASAIGVVGGIWLYLVPAILAVMYTKDMGQPTGQLFLLCLLFPVIAPTLVAGSSKAEALSPTPDTPVGGKPLREWAMGEAVSGFRTNKLFGLGGKMLIQTTEGIIRGDNKEPMAARWNEIKEVYQTLRDQYVNGQLSAQIRLYRLVLVDGRRFAFDNRFGDVEELGKQVHVKVTENLLPAVVKQIEGGERASFGPVTLDQSAIGIMDDRLPWDEVADVTVNAGYLVVARRPASSGELKAKRAEQAIAGALMRIATGRTQPKLPPGGGAHWQKVDASKVPNIYLLIHLSHAMISFHGQGEKEESRGGSARSNESL
jgi:hypothetical protein